MELLKNKAPIKNAAETPTHGVAATLRSLTLGIALSLSSAAHTKADDEQLPEYTPTVRQEYDKATVVIQPDGRQIIHFFNNDMLIDTRIVYSGMQVSHNGKEFVIWWNDYGVCNRVVTTPSYGYVIR